MELDRFVRDRIQTRPLYGVRNTPLASSLRGIDTFIVGGDQVWRPNPWLDSFFLSFVDDDFPCRRIAYGVSFGVDAFSEQEYERLRSYRSWVTRFGAISVREDAGIRLCSQLWGVDAQWVADPVLLLSADHYREIASEQVRTSPVPGLLNYVLDASEQKCAIISDLAAELGMTSTSVCPPQVTSRQAYRQDPGRWVRPSMEVWLGDLSGCDYVVTDSYHGVVLSLLFHKPFVAIGNRQRGLSRFESLLGRVGLRSRLVTDRSELSFPLPEIDWTVVQKCLDELIDSGWHFLRDSLENDRR